MPTGPGFPSSPVQPPRRAPPRAAQASAPLGGGCFGWAVWPSSAAETAARPGGSGASHTSVSGRGPAPARAGPSGRHDTPALHVLAQRVWKGAGSIDTFSRSNPWVLLVPKPGSRTPRRRERGVSPRACSPVSRRGRVSRGPCAGGPPAGGSLARAAPMEPAVRAGTPGSIGLLGGGLAGPARETNAPAGRALLLPGARGPRARRGLRRPARKAGKARAWGQRTAGGPGPPGSTRPHLPGDLRTSRSCPLHGRLHPCHSPPRSARWHWSAGRQARGRSPVRAAGGFRAASGCRRSVQEGACRPRRATGPVPPPARAGPGRGGCHRHDVRPSASRARGAWPAPR